MQEFLDNWYIIFGIIVGCSLLIYGGYVFITRPTNKKISMVKEWLLYAVTEAEKNLGGGTGQIKLRYVYSMFIAKFPLIAKVISFESFSVLVDEALDKFKNMLESNTAIKKYVNSEETSPKEGENDGSKNI